MKKNLMVFVLSVFYAVLPASPASADFNKTKIAVLDFQLQGWNEDSADMGKIVAEWLITALVKEGRFDVIERRLLEKVLEEQKMHASGLVDESSASRLGKVLGARIVITGSVMRFQNIMEVNARIIEVESSSIIAAESVKSASAVKLEDLVVQMAEKIIRDFPLEGYVVQREGSGVLIDLGKRAGVRAGMHFIVYKEGSIIRHPKTGEVLDIERIETGTIEISKVKTKTADAKILRENENDTISTGQLVKSIMEQVPPDSRRGHRILPAASASGGLASQLAGVHGQIEELRMLKAGNSREWKKKYKEVDHILDGIERQHRRSPDVYLSRARMLEAIDKPAHADKYIQKALSVRRHYPEAYALRGDIYIWDAMKSKPVYSRKKDLKLAINGYESAARHAGDTGFQAEIYLKMGNAWADLGGNLKRAKAFWEKAVAADPSSAAAGSAREKLRL